MAALVLTSILVLAIAVQARFPAKRMLIVLTGASVSCLASASFGGAGSRELLAEVPWDVLVLLSRASARISSAEAARASASASPSSCRSGS